MKIKKSNAPLSVIIAVICFVVLIVIDQLVKKWAVLYLKGQEPIIWVKGVFQLLYLENHGAAFGILQGQIAIFMVITVVIMAIIAYVYVKLPFTTKYRILRILLVLIASGAIGNAIDRVKNHYVVDFFYFNLINFPIFNVADIYVSVATIVLIVVVIFKFKDEDFQELAASLKFKKK